jgi:hypothetical protein
MNQTGVAADAIEALWHFLRHSGEMIEDLMDTYIF